MRNFSYSSFSNNDVWSADITISSYLVSGTAPVKPYVEQSLSNISGANPPAAGQTLRVAVGVTVTNPTGSAITFSTPSNIVIANVPGGGSVYAGTPALSQGTLISQPSIGGTGNIRWNPGTLAAGMDSKTDTR